MKQVRAPAGVQARIGEVASICDPRKKSN